MRHLSGPRCADTHNAPLLHAPHTPSRWHLQGKAGQGSGLFLSPYGVAQALGMLLNGVAPGGDSFRQLQVSSRAPAGGFRACRV